MSATNLHTQAALIGRHIGQSKTPAMHEAEGRAQGFSYSYDLIDISTKRFRGIELPQLLEMAEAEGYSGVNISHPFKVDVVEMLDELSDDARQIGAVNTVVLQGDKRIGYNTDYNGFKRAFQDQMGDAERNDILLLGAGGAGAAVALALLDVGVERLLIHDTDMDTAGKLAGRLCNVRAGASIRILQDLLNIHWPSIDGIINATPVGMDGYPGTPLGSAHLSPGMWVADIVYSPLETELLRQANERGCRTMNGAGMATYQAVDAFELITGRAANAERFFNCFWRQYAGTREQG